jgi:hypothetical protein
VDAADYTIWRSSFDETGYQLAADGNGNGQIDAGDYDIWRTCFGARASGTSLGFVAQHELPEPSRQLILFAVTVAILVGNRYR